MDVGFNWLDYTILVGYVFAILAIAALFVREQHNLNDFFMASRKMPWWAVGCSIFATLLSAISITGTPAEYWQNGFRAFGNMFIIIAAVPVVVFLFVRMYRQLNVITAYEYLEKRFSLSVRLVASFLFLLSRASYMGVVIVASAAVLKPAFGTQTASMVWLIIGIGVFSAAFAVMGGMKAVIWTDFIQMFVIYGGIAWMFISMLTRIDGGFAGMWQIAVENGKDFSYLSDTKYWSFDLFEKTTIWGIIFGYYFAELSAQGTDQLTVQRYLTTSSAKASAKSLWGYAFSSFFIIILLYLMAMALFAFYKQNPDINPTLHDPNFDLNTLLPHYIIAQLPHGISGLFIAAIIAAVLSTVDSGMNCLATATMNDFHIRLSSKKYTDAEHVRWARIWTTIWGVLSTVLAVAVFVTGRENITRTCVSIGGLFAGPLLGIFLLGMLVKRANTVGVTVAAVVSFAITVWANFWWTRPGPDGQDLHISFVWPVVIGTVLTCVIGICVSLFFPKPTEDKLTGLTFRSYLKKESKNNAV